MLVELEKMANTDLAIEVDGIVPDCLEGLNPDEIARLPVWIGRDKLDLGTVFQIEITAQPQVSEVNQTKIRWTGDLRNVHWIGAGMSHGEIEIESSAGHHVGYQMMGGKIRVLGSVADYAGLEMQGGLIQIDGDAGDHLGGCHSGSRSGMKRGEIIVSGNAGSGVGQRMRRGLIAISGKVGRLCGWNMLAGTILVIGKCGSECGSGMVRGTIIQGSEKNDPLLPTFSRGGQITTPIFALLADRLKALHFATEALEQPNYRQFHGDHLSGGRGEVFVRAD